MSQPLISLNSIEKSYQHRIFSIDKFDIFAGKCTIITGSNGSGKSTLLKIINGLVSADNGNICHKNQFVKAHKGHGLSSLSVYIPSKPYLFNLSVEHNVAYPLLLKQQFNHKRTLEAMLSWANLTHLKKRHPIHLSSGEMQRVALARARILNPPIWLLDEPTSNLDDAFKQQFYQLLNNLLVKQHSIIIATHSKEVVEKVPNNKVQMINQQLEYESA